MKATVGVSRIGILVRGDGDGQMGWKASFSIPPGGYGCGCAFLTCPSPATKELWVLWKEYLTVFLPILEVLGSGGLTLITKPEEKKITPDYLAKKTLNFVSFYCGTLCK